MTPDLQPLAVAIGPQDTGTCPRAMLGERSRGRQAVETGGIGRVGLSIHALARAATGLGIASGLLGASREKKEDEVLPDVGIELKKIQGDSVQAGETLCLLHARESERIERARSYVQPAYAIGGEQTEPGDRVLEEIRDDDLGKN